MLTNIAIFAAGTFTGAALMLCLAALGNLHDWDEDEPDVESELV